MTAFRPGLWTGMFFRHQLSFDRTLELLKDSGFPCAELCECYCRQFMERGFDEITEPKLELSQCHAPSGLAGYGRLWPVLKRFRIGCAVFHPLPGALDESLDFFRKLTEDGGEHGVRIAVENLIGVPGRSYEILLARIPELGINIDTAHALANGDKPEGLIDYFAGRVYGVHLSDSDGGAKDLHLRPGRGILDWKAVIAALKKAGYAGDFHLEIPHERGATLEETTLNARESCEAATHYLKDTSC